MENVRSNEEILDDIAKQLGLADNVQILEIGRYKEIPLRDNIVLADGFVMKTLTIDDKNRKMDGEEGRISYSILDMDLNEVATMDEYGKVTITELTKERFKNYLHGKEDKDLHLEYDEEKKDLKKAKSPEEEKKELEESKELQGKNVSSCCTISLDRQNTEVYEAFGKNLSGYSELVIAKTEAGIECLARTRSGELESITGTKPAKMESASDRTYNTLKSDNSLEPVASSQKVIATFETDKSRRGVAIEQKQNGNIIASVMHKVPDTRDEDKFDYILTPVATSNTYPEPTQVRDLAKGAETNEVVNIIIQAKAEHDIDRLIKLETLEKLEAKREVLVAGVDSEENTKELDQVDADIQKLRYDLGIEDERPVAEQEEEFGGRSIHDDHIPNGY